MYNFTNKKGNPNHIKIYFSSVKLVNVIMNVINYLLSDIADGLVGVGLITQSEDMPGMLQLDKGHNDMSKFLNRILGMKVEKQNLLFKYFSDTLNATISQAKRSGKYDQVSSL